MAITDVVAGIRTRIKGFDEKVGEELAHILETASDAIGDIPLKGIVPAAMRQIEEAGLKICQARLSDIQDEITRLQAEAANTSAIIAAGQAKIDVLLKHEKEMSYAAPEVAGQVSAFDPEQK